MQWVWIAAGGALGAMARHGVSLTATRLLGERFPWGTFAANALGSFVLGVLLQWFLQREVGSPGMRLMFTTGFLGAFTTFSTYSVQSVRLFEEGELGLGLANVLGNVVVGLGLAALGISAARYLG